MKLQTNNLFAIGLSIVILIFFYIILGFSGMLSALGIILLFIIPIYFILNNFDLRQDEKIVFSFFIGVGILPSITFWIGFFISFRLAILISFIILLSAGFIIHKLKRYLNRTNKLGIMEILTSCKEMYTTYI